MVRGDEITVRAPSRTLVRQIDDTRRWAGFRFRPDDVFVVTPPKSGTTWMQGIITSLLWPAGDAPGPGVDLSPWVDARFEPVESLYERLEAIEHRRFVKSHSPLDAIPFASPCRYIGVFRDGRDALASWGDHRRSLRPEVVDHLNRESAADGVPPMARAWDGDMESLMDEWLRECNPIPVLESFWAVRDQPNVLLVHYADLLADLDGEMRRVADFLDIEVPQELWGDVVDRCRFTSLRDAHEASGSFQLGFDGGAASFFHSGGVGRWEGVVDDRLQDRWSAAVAAALDAEMAEWLEHGSIVLGWRP